MKRLLLLLIAFCSFTMLIGQPLTGVKIIGTSGDYTTVVAAVADLNSNGVGSGGVTFNILPGTYTGQLTLTAVAGASMSDPVIFQSSTGDSTDVIIQHTSASSTTNWVIRLSGAKHVTFRKLTVKSLGTNTTNGGRVFEYHNKADSNAITNCVIQTNTTLTQTVFAGIYSTAASGNQSSDYNEFTNNRFIGGYYAIHWNAGGSSYRRGYFTAKNNVITEVHGIGIFSYYVDSLNISSNNITCRLTATTFTGIIIYYPGFGEVYKNIIHMQGTTTQNGITIGQKSITSPLTIANNFISQMGTTTGTVNGINLTSAGNVNVYYNTICIHNGSSTATSGALYQTGTTSNIVVLNNDLTNLGGGRAYFVATPASIVTSDYNNLYTTGVSLARQGAVELANLSDLQTTSLLDSNSVSTPPSYVSLTDLHTSNIGLFQKATPIAAIPDDIDGDIRHATTPCIGADEFFPASDDAGIASVDSPAMSIVPGTYPVIVTLLNAGISPLTSVTIKFNVNGGAISTYSWSGNIPVGGLLSNVNLGNYTFSAGIATIKAWTENPNGNPDGNHTNDTAQSSDIYVCNPMSGIYTIGGTGSDFSNLNEAVASLMNCGVGGAVTFKIANGTYVEQITISGAIPGASLTNSVTFQSQSEDSTSVIIQYAALSANDNWVVKLDGASFVTFSWLTFNATGAANGNVILLMNGANHVSVTHCRITTSTTATTTAFNGIYSTGGGACNYLIVKNCRFTGGAYNIYWYGSPTSIRNHFEVTGNIMIDFHTFGVGTYYVDSVFINGNHLTSRTSNSSKSAIYVWYLEGYGEITNNRIHLRSTTNNAAYGIRIDSKSNLSTDYLLVANNFVSQVSNLSTIYGIFSSSSHYVKIYHNSINITAGNANSAACHITATSSNINLRNNIFVNSNTGFAFYVATGASNITSDYNCYNSEGTYLAYYGANAFDILDLRTLTLQDANSVQENPDFLTVQELYVNKLALNNTGISVPEVPMDIDGELRNPLTPDIGAVEFTPLPDAAIIWVAPVGPSLPGNLIVQVIVTNTMEIPITSVDITYTDGVAPVAQSFSGLNISSGTGQTLSFSIPYVLSGAVQLRAVITSVNGGNDYLEANNTTPWQLIYPIFTAGSISADQSICSNHVPAALIGVAPTGGYEMYTYQWESSIDNLIFTIIPGANNLIYLPDPLTVTTYFRLKQIDLSDSAYTNIVTISVYPDLVPGTTSGDQFICYQTIPAQLTSTQPTGGNGVYTYQWEYSTDNVLFADIIGEIGLSHSPVPLTQTTYYRLRQTGNCYDTVTNIITISVYDEIVAGMVTADQTICANTTPAPISAVAAIGGTGGFTYQWQSSTDSGINFMDIVGENNLIYQPSVLTATTNYRLKVTSGICGPVYTSVSTVNVNALPVITMPLTLSIPFGTSASIQATVAGGTPPYSYLWSPADSIVGSVAQDNIVTKVLYGQTDFNLLVTDASTTLCQSSALVTVLLLGAPLSHSVNAIPATICAGQSVSLSALVTGGSGTYTYTWSSLPVGFSGSGAMEIVSPMTSTYYFVTINDGYTTLNDTVLVTVNQLPVVGLSGLAGSYCVNSGIATLTGSPAGGVFSGDGVLGSTFNPSVAGVGGSSVTYVYTDQNNCVDSVTHTTTVYALPVINFTAINPVCENAVAFMLSNATPVGGIYSGPGVTTGVFNPFVAGTGTQHISYAYVDVNSCLNIDSFPITVNPLPLATITPAGSTTFCDGGSVVLNANMGAGITYQWKKDGVNISGATTGSYSANASGSYTVAVTTTATGCTNTSTAISVTVNPLPTATATPVGATTFCDGGSVLLNANTGTGITYQWKKDGVNISGATTGSYSANASGSYTVAVTTTATGCTNTSTAISVTVNPLPTATATPVGATTFCFGDSVFLNANTGTGITYQWKKDGVNIPGATTSGYFANASGSYTVAVTTTATGCTNTSTAISVTVNPLPTATATPVGASTFCNGDSVLLNANIGTGITYQWIKDGIIIPGATSSSFSASTSGAYTVVVTITATGCTNTSMPITVTVHPIPTVSLQPFGDVCVYDTPFALTGGNPAGGTFSGIGVTAGIFNPSIAGAGQHSITYTYVDPNSCSSSAQNTIHVITVVADAGADTTVCDGQTAILAATGGTTYQWSNGATTATTSVAPSVTTTYYVTVTDAGCHESDSVVVIVNKVNFVLNDTVSFTPTILLDAGPGFTNYLWSNGSITQTTIVDTVGVGTGIATIWCKVTDAMGCIGIDTMLVDFNPLNINELQRISLLIIYPNPSGDIFNLELQGFMDEDVWAVVYNQQGQIIHRTNWKVEGNKVIRQLSLGSLPAGIYILKLMTDKQTITERLLVR
jgi:hypothetical protein